MERLEEAADLHRRAASLYREVGDDWDTAVALAHLATTLTAAGNVAEAAEHRREALNLLAAFTDPETATVRASIVDSLGT